MRRLLIAFMGLILTVSPVRAQSTPKFLVSAPTVSANTSHGQTYFYLILTQNVTLQFVTDPGDVQQPELVYIVVQQDGVGNHTISFAANIYGGSISLPPNANCTNFLVFFYDSFQQKWYGYFETSSIYG